MASEPRRKARDVLADAGASSLWILRDFLVMLVPAVLIGAVALFFAFRYVTPAPPTTIRMTTGGEAGAYYALGKRYAAELKRSGITVEVLTSAGSGENLKRLKDGSTGVSVALI